MPGKKHQPNKLSDYLEIHQTVMRQYIDRGFVLDDGLSFPDPADGFVLALGDVRCRGGILLTVRKVLRISRRGDETAVQTIEYKYNARLEGRGNIFRYDSPHRHRPYHHKHVYDAFDPAAHASIERTGDDWPTLGEVLEELRMWFFENYYQLSDQK